MVDVFFDCWTTLAVGFPVAFLAVEVILKLIKNLLEKTLIINSKIFTNFRSLGGGEKLSGAFFEY